jgi:hypothetical protein
LAGDEIIEDMARGPEAYLQMWERAVGVAPDSCRADVEDLTNDDLAVLEKGMSPEVVLGVLGQPSLRTSTNFTYCMTDDRVAVLRFQADGELSSWQSRSAKSAPGATRGRLK